MTLTPKQAITSLLAEVRKEDDYVRLSRREIKIALTGILALFPEEDIKSKIIEPLPQIPAVPAVEVDDIDEVTGATPLWQVLMHRDGMTEEQAIDSCKDARADLQEQLDAGGMPFDILADWFGLEPDWNDDLATNPRYSRAL